MDDATRLSDADLDRLLAGKAPLGAEDNPHLRNFFRDLRNRYVADPPPALREAHVAQMMKAARLPNDQKRPWTAPVAPAGRNNRPRWRRNLVSSSLFGSITAKILAGVVAAAAATGGLAAANALPKPVQAAVASAAGTVGVHLPDPQASTSASSSAEAQKLVSTVSLLVQQATSAASAPGAFSTTAVASATTCTQNVSAIASHLAAEGGGADTAPFAQSLAARAAALAQESVGCAIPGAGTGDPSTQAASSIAATGSAFSNLVQGAIGKAIVTTIQGCAAPLKAAIETLAQAALATDSTAQAQTLVTDARAAVVAAQTCARGIESAIALNLPAGDAFSPAPSRSGNPGPALAAIPPAVQNTPQPSATDASSTSGAPASSGITPTSPSSAAGWLKLLSSLPSSWGYGGGVTPTATSGSGGSGSWSGMTGSWNTSGAWSPYSGTTSSSQTQPTAVAPGARSDH